jgi:hypothetical protein
MTALTSRRIYLSASLRNAPINERLRAALANMHYTVILPQEFTPSVPDATLPRAIYDRCIEEMTACDLAILLLDGFGLDCANEAGWLAARRKPVVGLTIASGWFLQHWMVKGSLSALITFEPALETVLRTDPILRSVPVERVDGWDSLAAALDRVLYFLTKQERL